MGTPFLGEIKIVSFNFPPKGWATCNGQFLSINQNQALFSLLGTQYGGNGQTTFALPDFRGRVPLHVGSGYIQGQAGGQEAHTLQILGLAAHSHWLPASSDEGDLREPTRATEDGPVLNAFAASDSVAYASNGNGTMHSGIAGSTGIVGNTGGSQPHNNMPPFLVLNFIIALQGIFPSRS